MADVRNIFGKPVSATSATAAKAPGENASERDAPTRRLTRLGRQQTLLDALEAFASAGGGSSVAEPRVLVASGCAEWAAA